MFTKNVKLLLISTVILLLHGCATKPDLSNAQWVNHNQGINQQWKIKGKLAIITPENRRSAYLAWQQDQTEFVMALNTLIGSNIASLEYDGVKATLEVDGDTYTDTSPELLLKRTTGWDIPASSLPVWITGRAATDDTTTFYDNGLLKTLIPNCATCGNWEIQYERYSAFDFADKKALTLPSKLTLQGDTVKLIIRIDDWQAL